MNFLKEHTGAVITLLALVNLTISIIYNYFYFGSFDLSLDMIPATYSDYLISSLDVLAALLIYLLFGATALPLIIFFMNFAQGDVVKNKKLSQIEEENPLSLLFDIMKYKTYSLFISTLALLCVMASIFLYFDLYFDQYALRIIRNSTGVFCVFFIIYPIFRHFYGKIVSRVFFLIFFTFSLTGFWGSIAGHSIRFAEYVPHTVKADGCNNCVIIKSLSDTYILWDYSANKVVMLNKSEHDAFTIELRKNVLVK
jgi:hypothetical protein